MMDAAQVYTDNASGLSRVDFDPADMQPAADLVLIRLVQPNEMSDGGIILPQQSCERQNVGQVVAVGPKAGERDGRIKKGTWVLWPAACGDLFLHEGAEYRVISSNEVLAFLEESCIQFRRKPQPTPADGKTKKMATPA